MHLGDLVFQSVKTNKDMAENKLENMTACMGPNFFYYIILCNEQNDDFIRLTISLLLFTHLIDLINQFFLSSKLTMTKQNQFCISISFPSPLKVACPHFSSFTGVVSFILNYLFIAFSSVTSLTKSW